MTMTPAQRPGAVGAPTPAQRSSVAGAPTPAGVGVAVAARLMTAGAAR